MAKVAQDKRTLPDGLKPQKMRPACDPKTLGFENTKALSVQHDLVGQDRAMDAIRLSADIGHKDFNLYVLGHEGTGRHTTVSKLLAKAASSRPTPCDWVYINNFDAPHKPNAMSLPAGAPIIK